MIARRPRARTESGLSAGSSPTRSRHNGVVPTDFTATAVLTGDLVRLRPVEPDDVPALQQGMADPEVSRLTGSVRSDAEDDAPSWTLEQLQEIYARWRLDDDRLVWAIEERGTGRVVGEILLNDLDAANRRCGLRLWISGARGRGLGTEAVSLALRHAFVDQGLNRVELEVYDFNPRARHVYEKLGFRWEGTQRQALRWNDGWVDAHDLAILAEDWFALQAQAR